MPPRQAFRRRFARHEGYRSKALSDRMVTSRHVALIRSADTIAGAALLSDSVRRRLRSSSPINSTYVATRPHA